MGNTEKHETPAKTVAATENAPGETNVETSTQVGRAPAAKRLIIIFILLALLIFAAAYAYFNRSHKEHVQPQGHSRVMPPKTAYDKANEVALSGNGSQAQAILDAQLKTASTPEQKGALYEQKASIALTVNDAATGLQYAQQAETLHPTRNSAYLIAECAQLGGDKTMAIKYYQIVISRTNPNIDDYTIPQLKGIIKTLQG